MAAHRRYIPLSIIFLLGLLILTACEHSQTKPNSPTKTTTHPTATLTFLRNTSTVVQLPETTRTTTPFPTQNKSNIEAMATLPITSVAHTSQQEIAQLLFGQWLHQSKANGDLDEYEIIKVETPESYSYLAQEKSVDFIATVVFSVKPGTNAYLRWAAGNGITSTNDSWIRNKFLIIGVYKENNTYKMIGLGTGP